MLLIGRAIYWRFLFSLIIWLAPNMLFAKQRSRKAVIQERQNLSFRDVAGIESRQKMSISVQYIKGRFVART